MGQFNTTIPQPPQALIWQDSVTCHRCDYILKGLAVSGVCPECGTPVETSLAAGFDRRRLRHVRRCVALGVAGAAALLVFGYVMTRPGPIPKPPPRLGRTPAKIYPPTSEISPRVRITVGSRAVELELQPELQKLKALRALAPKRYDDLALNFWTAVERENRYKMSKFDVEDMRRFRRLVESDLSSASPSTMPSTRPTER